MPPVSQCAIVVRGARQNNLKNLDLDIPLGELIVVTGVSGSGKSSLVFDTLYAEGQRRYVETFSPYARQFLDRMDKPAVDRIEGIPPAIAIDQTNPVRTSRSTVGTMTELNDHLKLLFARAAHLHCRRCARPVRRDSPESICEDLLGRAAAQGDPRLLICFPVCIPKNFKEAEVIALLEKQGYTRIHERSKTRLEVVQDRLRVGGADRSRVFESIDAALRVGQGKVNIHALAEGQGFGAADSAKPVTNVSWRYSSGLHCADCDLDYREPSPSSFSFNSPLGACDACRGFGRIIGVDYGLVIPDESKSLAEGAIKPFQYPSFAQCQKDLKRLAKLRGIPLDVPWRDMTDTQRAWVINREGKDSRKLWYGVKGFFEWLEKKAYKMHIRVLLSKYRAYTPCTVCDGARLKADSLLWRLGDQALASNTLGATPRFRPAGARYDDAQLAALPGLTIHDLMLLPIERLRGFFGSLRLPGALDEATDMLLGEIRSRLKYLDDVGLGYLTLDRQSRTLSGGEVQRINLTTALGTSLVNTLFVLDEPSIGLHPRDMRRIIAVMHRLRDAGNSLVVVEHDPQIMLEADRVLDMGPGAGEHGGQIVCFDTPTRLRSNARSLTGAYLSGAKRVSLPPAQSMTIAPKRKPRHIELTAVSEHNLRAIDVRVPLDQLVCVTGVSGSGKSTLVQNVLYPALLKAKDKPSESPGAYLQLSGAEHIVDVVMVDQSPIGRTARSNPASYVGAFDVIRERFAKLPESRERKYTAGTFSFNSGTGRCPTCAGTGFEHVEMQFLSDVYLRCPDCDGRRFRATTLEVTYTGAGGRTASIADVLAMTVTAALAFFGDLPELAARLQPLADVGLEYLTLGQPVPTLSGGEAQRLKLAGHLAAAAAARHADSQGKLFLFDEPTTGLHFADVAKLLQAFRKLLDSGHSLLVIEHNLDVIRAADWIIDLGPEGGEHGGSVVCVGTPAHVRGVAASHTGVALTAYEHALTGSGPTLARVAEAKPVAYRPAAPTDIVVHKAREHNLKNIDVAIPLGQFSVITGVSGSGKSTLAFDIIFNEGQRRYLESLNAYARQFVQPASRPDVDAIYGIPPTVAIEQRTSRGGRKSTVATLTEIYHFLRLLYVKLGMQYCPDCQTPIEPQTAEAIVERIQRDYKARDITLLAPLIVARKGLYTDLAKWAAAKGYKQLRVDGALTPTKPWPRLDRFVEHNIELPVDRLIVNARHANELHASLASTLEFGKGVAGVVEGAGPPRLFSTKRACPSCGTSFPELDPRLFSFNSKHGWCGNCFGTGEMLTDFSAEHTGEERMFNEWYGGVQAVCSACHGQRLNPVALNIRFRSRSIAQLTGEPVSRIFADMSKLKLDPRETAIARDLLAEIRGRLSFLQRVGLGYLALNRAAPTLSGGEAQRIRLAAQLGSNLRGVCYVLDEPTIGLHPRDNRILLDALSQLSTNNNTLVVVEHDEETIRRADHVIDLGPGAGVHGGAVVGAGTVKDLIANSASVTGRFLREPLQHPAEPQRAVSTSTAALRIEKANLHNLRDIDVRIPLGRLIVITGVSGSGKSSLARGVLFASLRELVGVDDTPNKRRTVTGVAVGCVALRGIEKIDRVLEVDQTPIGKTPRSCPATYVGLWDEVRRIYAGATESRMRGYTASRFSFNTAGGRCEACEGQGLRTIEMSFLPDVKVRCDVCSARRFNSETLGILWRGRSISDILDLSVSNAIGEFSAHPVIHHGLKLLEDVGLGYLTLGQPSPTLSGGEAQRIKLVTELAKVRSDVRSLRQRPKHTLYVLDEPTVGLHMADVEKLITALHRLVAADNTIVVVEHNLDVIAEADWLIDMGPEAGDNGGRIVAQGAPQQVAALKRATHTSTVLAQFLRTRGRRDR